MGNALVVPGGVAMQQPCLMPLSSMGRPSYTLLLN